MLAFYKAERFGLADQSQISFSFSDAAKCPKSQCCKVLQRPLSLFALLKQYNCRALQSKGIGTYTALKKQLLTASDRIKRLKLSIELDN
ncbi:hypothetical protein BpHYR1_047210 [Brachionus plicatilis]|uniref:Uncharacterized protein n=1 Tax=Brachionus plicatilis TaxID=10195 RepID=A0A3M7R3P3_BRAPC|nr:hypothetical protein BpHYR1_047210 [Brachionus plicatilis]